MSQLIDTHCHLTMPHFDADRNDVIKRAQQAGVAKIITIGTDLEDSKRAIELAEGYEFIFASVGIHPHDVKDIKDPEATYKGLKSLASNKKVVAIGETGLDYHYLHSPSDLQQEHFRMHIEIARALDLPIIIHSREAREDTLKILKGSACIERSEKSGHGIKGVFHCFSGDMDMAEKVLEMGFHISFSGIVTFKNAKGILDIVKAIPIDRILVETDAPYLTPEPHRGKRNEPNCVIYVTEKVAEVKGLSLEAFGRTILNNAVGLFKIDCLTAETGINIAAII